MPPPPAPSPCDPFCPIILSSLRRPSQTKTRKKNINVIGQLCNPFTETFRAGAPTGLSPCEPDRICLCAGAGWASCLPHKNLGHNSAFQRYNFTPSSACKLTEKHEYRLWNGLFCSSSVLRFWERMGTNYPVQQADTVAGLWFPSSQRLSGPHHSQQNLTS